MDPRYPDATTDEWEPEPLHLPLEAPVSRQITTTTEVDDDEPKSRVIIIDLA